MNRRKCTGTTASDRKFLTCLDDTSCQQWAFIAFADGEHFRNQCAQEREERTGHMRPCTPSICGVLLLLGPFLQQYVDGKDSNTSSEFRRTQTSGRCYPDNSVSTRTSSYGCHAAKFCSNQLSADRLGTMSLASCNREAVDFEWFSSFSSLFISFLTHRFNNFNISPSLHGGVLFTAVVADGLWWSWGMAECDSRWSCEEIQYDCNTDCWIFTGSSSCGTLQDTSCGSSYYYKTTTTTTTETTELILGACWPNMASSGTDFRWDVDHMVCHLCLSTHTGLCKKWGIRYIMVYHGIS